MEAPSTDDVRSVPVIEISRGTQVWMLLTNALPLLHVLSVGVAGWCAAWFAWWAVPMVCLTLLYLLPPLTARVVMWLRPVAEGKHELDSAAFRVWWLTSQCQMVFNRLPMLEEALRLVPGLYSHWLRLWGAKVGRLVFWSPGVTVLDRAWIDVGDHVVFGVGVRLHPHLIVQAEASPDQLVPKRVELWLAPIRIGEGSLVGGFSLLAPGVTVAPQSVTPAIHALPAFTRWEGGQRIRKSRPTVV